jgi:hypothetical protein
MNGKQQRAMRRAVRKFRNEISSQELEKIDNFIGMLKLGTRIKIAFRVIFKKRAFRKGAE